MEGHQEQESRRNDNNGMSHREEGGAPYRGGGGRGWRRGGGAHSSDNWREDGENGGSSERGGRGRGRGGRGRGRGGRGRNFGDGDRYRQDEDGNEQPHHVDPHPQDEAHQGTEARQEPRQEPCQEPRQEPRAQEKAHNENQYRDGDYEENRGAWRGGYGGRGGGGRDRYGDNNRGYNNNNNNRRYNNYDDENGNDGGYGEERYDSYRPRGRGGRGGRGGYRGGYNNRQDEDNYDDYDREGGRQQEQPRDRDQGYDAPRDVAPRESAPRAAAPRSDASADAPVSRRTQRPPHLRCNCRNEAEVLALFQHHHLQAGITLDNYSNIPVEIVPCDIMAVENFDDLNVEPGLSTNIQRCGYQKPTPVQRFGIPVAMAGKDLMACAQTGSGKTAAFLVPVVNFILVNGVSPARRGVAHPIGLVMAPTRELALQINDEVKKLTFRTDVFYDVVYGGTAYPSRFDNDILVACPGRLKDIFDRGTISFSATKFLILDEADRMLEMGFEEQIEYLVASRYTDMPTAENRQTLMFSATFPQRILNLAKRYLRRQYYLLTVGRVGSTTKNITQVIERVDEADKKDRLFEIIYQHKTTDLVLIFVETKKSADDLHRELDRANIPNATIHGDRRQQDRERALAEFKSGETPILVATDVASRGLDIPNVSHVIQYDLPSEMDDYTHRIGRTGRAGNKGTATCFYNRSSNRLCLELYKYFTEHEQEVPGWFKDEAEMVEGEGMLARTQGGGGMRRRGGGGGGGGGGATYSETRRPPAPSNATWGESGAARVAPAQSNRGRNRNRSDVDDGGF